MSYLETEAGRRETARHLAAVRAERGVEEAGFASWRANLHPRDRTGKFRDLFTAGPTRAQAHDVVHAQSSLNPPHNSYSPPPVGSFTIHHATKGGPTYRITHRTDDNHGAATGGFGVSEKTGQWVAWRQVGPKIPGRDMIPVDVAHARDLGDAAGTLEFDWAKSVRSHAHVSMGHNTNPGDWKHLHGSARPMPKGKPVPTPKIRKQPDLPKAGEVVDAEAIRSEEYAKARRSFGPDERHLSPEQINTVARIARRNADARIAAANRQRGRYVRP